MSPRATATDVATTLTNGRYLTVRCHPAKSATAKLTTRRIGKNVSPSRPSSIVIDAKYAHVAPMASIATTRPMPTEYPIPVDSFRVVVADGAGFMRKRLTIDVDRWSRASVEEKAPSECCHDR